MTLFASLPPGGILLILLLCAAYAALFLWVLHCAGTPKYVTAKVACSTIFVVAAVLFSILGTAPGRLLMMLDGFIACALGDFLLALYNLHRKRWQMLLGMLLFFSAHSCFFAAFCLRQAVTPVDFVIPVISAVAVVGLLCLPKMNARGFRAPAVLYSFIVMLMFSKALAIALAAPGFATIVMALGAGLAAASDAIIIFLYFYGPAKKNRAVHFANLLTYYLGIFLMAMGMMG